MEDSSKKSEWVYRHRRKIAVIVSLYIAFNLVVILPRLIMQLYPEHEPYSEPSHSFTVWILPEDVEFHLHLDVYLSEQDAAERVNRLVGKTIRVQPLDDEQNDGFLDTLSQDVLSVWVKIYFNQDTEEPFIIHRVDLGQRTTTSLQGREISILMEIWQGENS